MNYDTFLFKGHGLANNGQYDPGAISGPYREAELVSDIVNIALDILKSCNLKIHTVENNYNTDALRNNTYKYHSGLSVHINSGGGTGTEIFTPMQEKYLLPDFNLINDIANILHIPNRGVKSRELNSANVYNREHNKPLEGSDYYGEINRAWSYKISLSLLEICFIDSSTDLISLLENKYAVAKCIAEYIATLCNTKIIENEKIYKLTIPNLTQKEAETLIIKINNIGYDSTIEKM